MLYIWTLTGGVSGTEPRASAAFLTLFIFLKILLLAKKHGEQYRHMLPTFLKQVFSRVCAFCVNVCVDKLWIKVLKNTGQATSSVCMCTVCVHMHACHALHRVWRGEMDVRGLLLFCLFVCCSVCQTRCPQSFWRLCLLSSSCRSDGVAEALCHAHLSVWVNYLGIQAQVLTLQAGTLPNEPSPQLDRLF